MNEYKLIYTTTSSLLNDMGFTNDHIQIIAGPCAVESYESTLEMANFLLKKNITFLRAGAYKPRTSPYDFQGLGDEGIDILIRIKKETGIKIVTEINSVQQIPKFVENIDIIQIGARNMQNFELLKALGKTAKPIILKRGFGCTIDEWLGAAEYILAAGNPNVILCERGIKSFDTTLRNSLDLGAVVYLKQNIKLPVIVDPSHAAGNSELVPALALAGIAAGANGLLIEVHNNPHIALSDGQQSLSYAQLNELLIALDKIAFAIDKAL